MPLLTVAVTGSPGPGRSAAIASALTRLTEQHLGKDPALTAVAVHYLDPADWFIGGQPLDRDRDGSFSLLIKVTEGTNTKSQFATYIASVFAAMAELTGALHEESYVVIEEVPAAAWGYGGRTQEHRFVAAQLQPTA